MHRLITKPPSPAFPYLSPAHFSILSSSSQSLTHLFNQLSQPHPIPSTNFLPLSYPSQSIPLPLISPPHPPSLNLSLTHALIPLYRHAGTPKIAPKMDGVVVVAPRCSEGRALRVDEYRTSFMGYEVIYITSSMCVCVCVLLVFFTAVPTHASYTKVTSKNPVNMYYRV